MNSISSPGPGAYSPKAEASKYKNPVYKFPKQAKLINSRDISPGPGAYEGGKNKQIGNLH